MNRVRATVLAVGAAGAVAAWPVPTVSASGSNVTVMTRNVAVGASLGGGLTARNPQELSDRIGEFMQQVAANDFSIRAQGLASEILRAQADLVGLQEVAWWRTAPCAIGTVPPQATDNRYDYLSLLLDRLNRHRGVRYRAVVIAPQFDFEAPGNLDGDRATGVKLVPGHLEGCEANVRLTMRDVILVKDGVVIQSAASGSYQNLLASSVAGSPVKLTRGWARVDAEMGGRRFRFVNTQLEAFDDQTPVPSLRARQAGELIAPGGPASGELPVILVGDLNSGPSTDGQAFRALVGAGFSGTSSWRSFTCCITSYPRLAVDGGGSASQFDHTTDHVMINAPHRLRLVHSRVTGLFPVNGFWSSDHAGVATTFKVR